MPFSVVPRRAVLCCAVAQALLALALLYVMQTLCCAPALHGHGSDHSILQ